MRPSTAKPGRTSADPPIQDYERPHTRRPGASPAGPKTPISPLTAREAQIASMAAAGYANQEIADRLFITTHTVEYHLKKVFRKTRHRLPPTAARQSQQ